MSRPLTAAITVESLKKEAKRWLKALRANDEAAEILAGMPSLERVSFYGCPGVTDAGVAALARLPRLREVDISGPNITREGWRCSPRVSGWSIRCDRDHAAVAELPNPFCLTAEAADEYRKPLRPCVLGGSKARV
jgi:hypothetical protein